MAKRWLADIRKRLLAHPTFVAFSIILVLAICLRLFALGTVPGGINQDEASAAYESYSLLHHGTDKWGYHLPVYFVSWGSGQNVLESYLAIPFIAIFGLSSFAIRLVPALLGIGSVVLLFLVARQLFGKKVALWAALLLAVCPWAVLTSRFAVESDILPFFVLLGIWSVMYTYRSPHKKYLVPVSLVPFALALYAYVTSIVVIPFMLAGVLVIYGKKHREIWRSMLLSFAVFAFVAAPIFLFLLDNTVLHKTPAFVDHLPFSVPLLLESRLSQDNNLEPGRFHNNVKLFATGFSDNSPWASLPGYSPTLVILPLLAVAGLVFLLKSRLQEAKLFAIWFAASFLLAGIVTVNDIRGNTFLVPLVLLAAYGLVRIIRELPKGPRQRLFYGAMLLFVTIYCGSFFYTYFRSYNTHYAYNYFNSGLDTALAQAGAHAKPNEKIYVSNSINLNYVYTLFYLKADSQDFRANATYSPVEVPPLGKIYQVVNYRNYYFMPSNASLLAGHDYIYLLKYGDTVQCKSTSPLYTTPLWRVGRCVR